MPVEAQQAPPAPKAPQTTPPPSAEPAAARAVPATSSPLDGLSYAQLKSRQAELQDQRQALANRRADVASRYERASGVNKEGIAQRLGVMDRSMAQFEADLSAVGLAMVPKRGTETNPPPFSPRSGPSGGEMFLLSAGVFFATMIIAVPAAVRRAKRRWLRESPNGGTASLGAGNERLERIEQAVDTIAVEIERVSENQRFMTRLMTETQLAGTIAAVRNSADAAKREAVD